MRIRGEVSKIKEKREDDIRPCVGATYCLDRIYQGEEALCIHNAATGRELKFPNIISPSLVKKKIVVVGAGPAGLEAARIASERGHNVVVFEAAFMFNNLFIRVDILEKKGNEINLIEVKAKSFKKDEAIFNVLREYIKECKKVRFEGDGYSESWEKEAKKRKLSNNKTTPEALKVRVSEKCIQLFEELGVMNATEIHARYEIEIEEYALRIQIEGRVLGDIARNHVIPTAVKYQNILIENVQGLKNIYGKDFKSFAKEQLKLVEDISKHIELINSGVTIMTNERKKANRIENSIKRANVYCNKIKPYFEQIRYSCDKLELLIDDELWPLTKYRELLFTK